jgi:hypothetical protein
VMMAAVMVTGVVVPRVRLALRSRLVVILVVVLGVVIAVTRAAVLLMAKNGSRRGRRIPSSVRVQRDRSDEDGSQDHSQYKARKSASSRGAVGLHCLHPLIRPQLKRLLYRRGPGR